MCASYGECNSEMRSISNIWRIHIMKKRIITLFAIIAVFGLAVAAVAYAQTTTADSGRSSCCTKDSCPMKKKDTSAKETTSCCDDCDCCKDGKCTGDSCPMKKRGEAKATTVSTTESGKSNCDCCKGKHEPIA